MATVSIAILGPGGVGGFLAAALARAGTADVTVVAREPTAALIARDGIAVESVRLGDFVARPAAVPQLAATVDVLLVATKAAGLDAALARVDAEPALVVPLLNGLDHVARLRERFGPRAVAGTIRIEADRPQPGRVVQTSRFLFVDVASDDPGPRPRIDALAAALDGAGVPVRIGSSEAQVLWSKLVRLNSLACVTSAYDAPLGKIRDDPERRPVLEACVRETAAVACAAGAAIDPERTLAELGEAHATLGSSMRRDIAAGRPPELDAIAGAVLRAGGRLGVACPTVAELARQIAVRAGVPAPAAA
ncbi:ketopantoate reductase family protein [Conexibacter woesei]|uniref:2-dehydropantoate 2-reductase n=1 Tax=Conexibacter woesei (strain DSM 14684 / CCUG 47730 / CIP 108061 / JCM 11494 / NBRC 100937 / ID131577) TaxID=469383 RepID=D3FCK5_CONWI|nr:2-dehydropantoate 2-reductase [Conexibacter woesei]ADB49478.1 2-dehydropantoate 2-reductase [Conexibacter woesei DSM 14684]